MAFITKTKASEKQFVKATAMNLGESVTGYYLGIEKSVKGYTSIVLQTETGEKLFLSPSGNLNYFQKDQEEGKYVLNQLTRITRVGSRPSKKDKEAQVGIFKVEQDPDNVLDGSQVTANSTQADLKDKVKQMRAGKN